MPTVAILLCALNGARFLPLQLASFEQQTFADWRLVISDDGSTDATCGILRDFQKRHGSDRVRMKEGPRRGPTANFLSLACDENIVNDYYAFSDQDDVWEPDKLARAVAWLQTVAADSPAVYCSRTRLIDDEGKPLGYSILFKRQPSFGNALVQNIAGGNTMVFNRAARHLLVKCGPDVDVPGHDWWLYLITTAVGGTVRYDGYPSVRYRVHARNLIGPNNDWLSRVYRFKMLLKGRLRTWSEQNIAALERIRADMPPLNQMLFDLFRELRNDTTLRRLHGVFHSGIYRQTALGNAGLLIAALMKRI